MHKFRDKTPTRSKKSVKDYKDAFENLRTDFGERCGYCDVSDNYLTINYFEIDHYKPQSRFKHLKHTYSNLTYSCKNCNNFKSSYWATEDENKELTDGRTEGFLDPCTEEYTNLFERNRAGYIIPTDNPISHFIYKRLKLYLFKKVFYYKIEQIDKKITEIIEHKNNCNIDSVKLLKMKNNNQKLVNEIELAYKLKK
jgi:uncharacterized protein (TIGR02646 family)